MKGKKTPLLSICIPTYNKPDSIQRLLEDITPQVTPEVEVVIRDDGIDDKTEKIVKKWKKKIPLRYFHGQKKGVDVALLFLAGEARGKYLWWFGDDMMEKNTIQNILRILKTKTSISFIFVNSRQITDTKAVLDLGNDHFFTNKDQVLEQVGDLLGFISVIILRRDRVLSGVDKALKYVGSAWVSLYLILHVLSQDGKYFFISYPYVVSNPRDPAKPAWYDGFTVFAINFYYIVTAFKGKFSQRSIKWMLSENLNGILKGIFVYRAEGYLHGLGSKDPKIRPLLKLYWNFSEFWKYFPILLIPRPIAKILYRAYKKYKVK